MERQVRRHRVARSLSERCRVILRCADGLASKDVAAELGLHEHTVGKWRRRFLQDRCDGLLDEARPGRPRTIDDDQVAAVIERTLRTTPIDATHWSIRSMAAETGFSHTTIRRMWVAGLYLSPPNRALVLSIDEKSQIQALDREQPVLPMMPGVPERRTHSYVRHGTTSLFAALDVASGFVIGKCYKRHRAAEFLNFLKEIDAQVPAGLDIHIVMDNYATTRLPRSRRGSPADRIIMYTSRRLRRHGSIRSNAGSLNSPESGSSEVFIPRSGNSKPISAPSSIGTTKIPGPLGEEARGRGSSAPSAPNAGPARRVDRGGGLPESGALFRLMPRPASKTTSAALNLWAMAT